MLRRNAMVLPENLLNRSLNLVAVYIPVLAINLPYLDKLYGGHTTMASNVALKALSIQIWTSLL